MYEHRSMSLNYPSLFRIFRIIFGINILAFSVLNLKMLTIILHLILQIQLACSKNVSLIFSSLESESLAGRSLRADCALLSLFQWRTPIVGSEVVFRLFLEI